MSERACELVLFGATGFTGRLTAEYLARAAASRPLSWAIAGRDAGKLAELAAELGALAGGAPPAVLLAAVDDAASLRRAGMKLDVLDRPQSPS